MTVLGKCCLRREILDQQCYRGRARNWQGSWRSSKSNYKIQFNFFMKPCVRIQQNLNRQSGQVRSFTMVTRKPLIFHVTRNSVEKRPPSSFQTPSCLTLPNCSPTSSLFNIIDKRSRQPSFRLSEPSGLYCFPSSLCLSCARTDFHFLTLSSARRLIVLITIVPVGSLYCVHRIVCLLLEVYHSACRLLHATRMLTFSLFFGFVFFSKIHSLPVYVQSLHSVRLLCTIYIYHCQHNLSPWYLYT